MNRARPVMTTDLAPSERALLETIRALGFGQIEFLRIRAGAPVVDPWPTVVRDLKFGVDRQEPRSTAEPEFELKREVADLFEYTRDVEDGEIRTLVVRHGLPFSMEVELAGSRTCALRGGLHD
jgi:hypothetical protein